MGKTNIGLYYKYNWIVEGFHELGFEYCKLGVHYNDILDVVKRLHPRKFLAMDGGATWVRGTLSAYRIGRRAEKTPRMRSPELFLMLGDGFWKLKEFEDKRLLEEQREQVARAVREGEQFLRQHLQRERSSIAQNFKQQLMDLSCEACGFDFETCYGDLGHGYIEAHHVLPLSAGSRKTRIEDFQAVCANCHRMIHRKGLVTVEELRAIIAQASA